MTGADVAALITAAGAAIAAVMGGVSLVRQKSGQITVREREEAELCFEQRRAAYRWVRVLRDLLSEAGITEPEGIDDELGLGRHRATAGEKSAS